jgi:hypothetical protein
MATPDLSLRQNRDRFLWILVTLLFAAFLANGLGAVRLNTDLQAGDQGAYLQLALAQKEGRAFTDGNRHPLHPALLIPLAERRVEFFARARWVSYALGACFLLGVLWMEWRDRRDPWTLFFFLAFFAVHGQMRRTVSEIWCEPLLYPLVFFLWWLFDRTGRRSGEREADAPATGGSGEGFRMWAFLGLLAGLGYLTKGSGSQIAGLFFLSALLFVRSWRKIGLALVVFLAAISPLVVWNLATYGDPLYSFASTHNMWFDEADEIWYDNPDDLPTLGTYLETHTLSEILARVGKGLVLETRMAGYLLWTDWRFAFGEAFSLPNLLLFPLKLAFYSLAVLGSIALLGSRETGQAPATWRGGVYFVLLVAAFFLTFGWYAQLTDAPRFLMTLVPIAVLLLARSASAGWSTLQAHCKGKGGQGTVRLAGGLLALEVLAILALSLWFAVQTSHFPPPGLNPLSERMIERLNSLPEDAHIAYGPSHGLPLWMTRGDLTWRPTPWRIDFATFEKTLERERIEYVLLDTETLARREYLRFLATPGGMESAGWKLLHRDRDEETVFLLYEVGK